LFPGIMSARLLAAIKSQRKEFPIEEGIRLVADCLQFAAEDEVG